MINNNQFVHGVAVWYRPLPEAHYWAKQAHLPVMVLTNSQRFSSAKAVMRAYLKTPEWKVRHPEVRPSRVTGFDPLRNLPSTTLWVEA